MRVLSLGLVLVSCLALAACGGKSSSSGGGHAGLYSLDKAHLKQMALDNFKEQSGMTELPPEQVAMLDGMLAQAAIDLDLKADGTWTVKGTMGGEKLDEMGTWTVNGQAINFKTTKKDGNDASEEKTGSIADGVIMVKPDDSAPGEIRLVRK